MNYPLYILESGKNVNYINTIMQTLFHSNVFRDFVY